MLIKEEWTKLAISLTHALHVYIFKEIQTQEGRGCYKISVIEWYSKNPYHDLIYIGLHRKYTVLMRELLL